MSTSRRSFLIGAATALLAAPAIVRAASIMPVKVVPVAPWSPWQLTPHYWQDLAGTIPATADGDPVARIDMPGMLLTDSQIASLRTYLAAKQGRVL